MGAILDRFTRIVAFPFVALVRYHIFTGPNRRLYRKMKKQGRTADADAAIALLRDRDAALILEATTPGCSTYRVWVTDDRDGFTERPYDCGTERLYPKEDDLNYEYYLSESSGCARLTPEWYAGSQVGRFLNQHFGDVGYEDCLFIWTGWIEPK